MTGTLNDVLVRAEVTERPLDAAEYQRLVSREAAGAVVTFVGVVRDHDGGRSVAKLTYEAHPSAEEVLRSVVTTLASGRADLHAVAVGHRVGPLRIGDAAFLVAVSCSHRGPAFEFCHEVVDRVKELLPVWKHQVFTDGTDEWVNCP